MSEVSKPKPPEAIPAEETPTNNQWGSLAEVKQLTPEEARREALTRRREQYQATNKAIKDRRFELAFQVGSPERDKAYRDLNQQEKDLKNRLIDDCTSREGGLADLMEILDWDHPYSLITELLSSSRIDVICNNLDQVIEVVNNHFESREGKPPIFSSDAEYMEKLDALNQTPSDDTEQAKKGLALSYISDIVLRSFHNHNDVEKFLTIAIFENIPLDDLIPQLPTNIILAERGELESRGYDLSEYNLDEKEAELLKIAEGYAKRYELYDNLKTCVRLGIDLKKAIDKDIGEGYPYVLRSHLDELNQLGLTNLTEQDIDDLERLKKTIERPEFSNHYYDFASAPEIVRTEHNQLFADLNNEDNRTERAKMFETVLPQEWNALDNEARIGKVQEFADLMAKQYGLAFPFTIQFDDLNRSDDDLRSEGRTLGRAAKKWFKVDGVLGEKLSRSGIEAGWVTGSNILIDSNHFKDDDAGSILDTVAHELFHAFQRQQAFLFAQGYFDSEHGGERLFPETPNLAERYLATYQVGSYKASDEDYVAYRGQILEVEAFEIGDSCQKEFNALRDTKNVRAEESLKSEISDLLNSRRLNFLQKRKIKSVIRKIDNLSSPSEKAEALTSLRNTLASAPEKTSWFRSKR